MEKIKCRECGKIDEILIKESEDYICEDCCDISIMELTKKEKELIKEVLTKYEKENYMNISKKENNWLFNLIDKFN